MVRGSNPGGGRDFPHPSRPVLGPPSLLYNGYRVFPGGKGRPRREADPSPPSSTVAMKEQSYTCNPPVGRTACTEPQCLYNGALYHVYLPYYHSNSDFTNSDTKMVSFYYKYIRSYFLSDEGGGGTNHVFPVSLEHKRNLVDYFPDYTGYAGHTNTNFLQLS